MSVIFDDINLDDIIASVPKPEPFTSLTIIGGPVDFDESYEINVYTYPPDAQAEINHLNAICENQLNNLKGFVSQLDTADGLLIEAREDIERINAKATEREGFIDQLLEDLRLAREQLPMPDKQGEALSAGEVLSLWRECACACNDGNALKFARAIEARHD